MRIVINDRDGYLSHLGIRMMEEGDDVVTNVIDHDPDMTSDLVISDRPVNMNTNIPVFSFGTSVPKIGLELMGYNTKPLEDHEYRSFFVIKMYDPIQGFGDQTVIALGLDGMMNRGLGLNVNQGYALRYVPEGEGSRMLTENDELRSFLQKTHHNGFVCLEGRVSKGHVYVHAVTTDVPPGILYGLALGVSTRLSQFFLEHTHLRETWVCSLMLTRYPYPFSLVDDRAFLTIDRRDVLEYIQTPFVRKARNSMFTDSTIIGYATSWDTHLNDASKRVLASARHLHVSNLQYRTDMDEQCRQTYIELLNSGIVQQGSHSLPQHSEPNSLA